MSDKRNRRGYGPQRFDRPSDFAGSMKKLLAYIKHYKAILLVSVLFAILSTVFNIAGPKILAKATDEIVRAVIAKVTGEGAGIDFSYLGKIMTGLIALYGISTGFGYVQAYIMAKIASGVSYDLRKDLINKIHALPLDYYNRESYGNVLSRISNDVDAVNTSLAQSLSQGITAVTSIIGVLIMMLTISVRLTLISLLIIPVVSLIVSQIIKRSQRYFKDQQDILGKLNGKIEEDFAGHLVIKAFNQEENRCENFNEVNEDLQGVAWKAAFASGLMMPVMTIVSNVGYVAICVIGASLAAAGSITIGGIQAFIQYVRNFTQPIAQLGSIFNQLQLTAAAVERIFDMLEEEDDVDYVTDPSINLKKIQGGVEFKNVQFGYNDDAMIIHNFSTKVEPGQKVAIVGPTGAGKTTLVKLLMGFYELNGGKIEIDGHDLKKFSKFDLREEFTMVLQDTWLFNGTIMENIRYGRLNASDEEVYQAARAAQVDHFIRTLPEGYNTVIDEEASNISQGQKQLLTIARAMVANSSILILDEATSSVDTRTEVQIQRAMDQLMEGRTSFVIAHRLSTIRDADTILVMNQGDIIEKGNHEELMALNGFYADLYNSQF